MENLKIDIWKVLTTLATTGLAFAFGWIIKVEVNMTQLRSELSQVNSDISDVENDIADIERDFSALLIRQQKDEVAAAKMQADVRAILDKVEDIKKALDK